MKKVITKLVMRNFEMGVVFTPQTREEERDLFERLPFILPSRTYVEMIGSEKEVKGGCGEDTEVRVPYTIDPWNQGGEINSC